MNCKQGDMAVVVRSSAGNEGRVVTCLEYVGSLGIIEINGEPHYMASSDYWRVDRDLNLAKRDGRLFLDHAPFIPDSFLMPISGYKEPMVIEEEEGEPA